MKTVLTKSLGIKIYMKLVNTSDAYRISNVRLGQVETEVISAQEVKLRNHKVPTNLRSWTRKSKRKQTFFIPYYLRNLFLSYQLIAINCSLH